MSYAGHNERHLHHGSAGDHGGNDVNGRMRCRPSAKDDVFYRRRIIRRVSDSRVGARPSQLAAILRESVCVTSHTDLSAAQPLSIMASERVSAASMEKAAVAKSFLEQHMSSKMESIREQRERYRHPNTRSRIFSVLRSFCSELASIFLESGDSTFPREFTCS